jgi:hypothetical protein
VPEQPQEAGRPPRRNLKAGRIVLHARRFGMEHQPGQHQHGFLVLRTDLPQGRRGLQLKMKVLVAQDPDQGRDLPGERGARGSEFAKLPSHVGKVGPV